MMIGCDKAEGGGEPTTPKTISTDVTPQKQTPVAKHKADGKLEWTYVELDLDDMLFEDAFRIQYNAKGEGHTFWWNGELYTTNLHTGNECGVCDGTGMITWYKDSDGDGLGDIQTRILDCNYPSVDEE